MAKPISEDAVDVPPVPGHRNYLVYWDESGIDGQKYYGFGSLWLPWERRGDLTGLVNELRERHRYNGRDQVDGHQSMECPVLQCAR